MIDFGKGDVVRVFPRKTKATPDDAMAVVGQPTRKFLSSIDFDHVDVSVTFTWDIPKAEAIAEKIACWGFPVDVGGAAYGDRMSTEFVPGKYLRHGLTITSRGCPKQCWFCSVWKCAQGRVIELPVQDGWNILDDNILATSKDHFDNAIGMLKRQKQAPVFSGGLEAEFLTQYHADRLREVKPKSLYLAYDTLDDYDRIVEARKKFRNAGFSDKSHVLGCYVLIGYPEDSFEAAEKRLIQTVQAGYMPFAMLYRGEDGFTQESWRPFQREWASRYIVGSKCNEYGLGSAIF